MGVGTNGKHLRRELGSAGQQGMQDKNVAQHIIHRALSRLKRRTAGTIPDQASVCLGIPPQYPRNTFFILLLIELHSTLGIPPGTLHGRMCGGREFSVGFHLFSSGFDNI